MRYNECYTSVINAAYEFGAYRLIDKVEERLAVARLYHNALRSLDVYMPAKKLVEEALDKSRSEQEEIALKTVIKGLDILNDARYHPCYLDHRLFPLLRQYHEAIALVAENLESLKNGGEKVSLHEGFLEAIETVTSGNGLYVVNWKELSRL